MNIAKVIAAGLWISACMGLGWYAGQRVQKRARSLEELHGFVLWLTDTVLPLSVTIPQACERYAGQHQGLAADFAASLAQALRQGSVSRAEYEKILKDLFAQGDLQDEPGVWNCFAESFACLQAHSDRELGTLLGIWEKQLGAAAAVSLQKAKDKAALYRTLGFLAGVLGLIWTA